MSVNSKMTAIADAIRGKTGGKAPLNLDQMATEIAGIHTGGADLPTLTNPGSAADLAQGKQLIGADGSVVEGSMEQLEPTAIHGAKYEIDGEGDFCISFEVDKPKYVNGEVFLYTPAYDLFGDATQDDVAAGKTFTNRHGLKIEGNLERTNGIYLGDCEFPEGVGGDKQYVEGVVDKTVILNSGAYVGMYVPADRMGDATPDDVRAGKYFTSASGFTIVGRNNLRDIKTITIEEVQ